ncbi:hypothetical protein SIAM614_20645 [Stappia aggregata IAM 12614]|uniref:Uncharacterized protein n=1 Tax=Roseibium aggregatum (strain ATCC 25650 / DSM 13394 / JCM 20685 / NBRC 16684 / NCIMB 2208 / IAM 12614 / B1) TaxID=384765 RepID=A0NYE0_ROSAI|nr:DUF6165 family protein [Roseibium aggregatum]EAV42136.1 hypothetical protein SIAM614_20645 [Stappia aggregata IAM 12614] [Roseibium aggregatum IAM 12614]
MVDLIYIPGSPAELIDRITILEIKASRISAPDKLTHVHFELSSLTDVFDRHLPKSAELQARKAQLKSLNETLWGLEDDIRNYERAQDFGEGFVNVARRIYQTNDKRTALKREINTKLGSRIVEVRSYSDGCSLPDNPSASQNKTEV